MLDWAADDLADWLDPLVAHLREPRGVRRQDGPAGRAPPLVGRDDQGRRSPTSGARRLGDVTPDDDDHVGAAGRRPAAGRRLAAAGGRGRASAPASRGTSSRCRCAEPARERRRCCRASTSCGGATSRRPARTASTVDHGGDRRPARRSTRSTSRPPSATTSPRGRWRTSRPCVDALRAEDPDRIRLYLAHHEGDLVAATTWVRVGEHAWYSYGASSTAKREVRGSNAIQWRMITRRARGGCRRLRPARHHRHPGRRRPPLRADPVQGRHRRRGRRVPRRVGPAAQPRALQGVRALHEAAR